MDLRGRRRVDWRRGRRARTAVAATSALFRPISPSVAGDAIAASPSSTAAAAAADNGEDDSGVDSPILGRRFASVQRTS